jgi:type I restriction enzyme S subunit
LKNSILQLAIQGKLVEQRPEEGTAEELYQLIQVAKQKLVKTGIIKKEKPLPEIAEDEKPFDIPDSWKWAHVIEIGISQTGNTPSKDHPEYVGDDIPFITPGDIMAGKICYSNQALSLLGKEVGRVCNSGAILQVCIGGSIGKAAVTSKEVAFNQQINAISPLLCDKQYVYSVMTSQYFLGTMKEKAGGTATPIINRGIWDTLMIPFPPLAEQKRIVAKIEELLPYIDRYKKAWSKLEDLNKRFPTGMQKSILQMAIQGKLVEQRPEEGTGEELYQQIQTEKQELIKAGTIKKEKPLPEITEDEKPFDIPESWQWVRLPEIGELSRGRSQHRPRNDSSLYINGTVPMIQTGDVARANRYITDWSVMYNEVGIDQSRIWKEGTICLTIAANIGDVAILKFDACFPDSVVGFNAYNPVVSNEYFMYGLMCYKSIFDAMSRSTAQKNINIDILSKIAFPLPPLAEQKRIVAKLEEILPLGEKLK